MAHKRKAAAGMKRDGNYGSEVLGERLCYIMSVVFL